MDTVFDISFGVALAVVLIYEAAAIIAKRRDWTISGRSWDARDYHLGRLIVDPLVIWLLWHIVIDDTFFVTGISWVDLIVVGIGFAWADWSWRHQHE